MAGKLSSSFFVHTTGKWADKPADVVGVRSFTSEQNSGLPIDIACIQGEFALSSAFQQRQSDGGCSCVASIDGSPLSEAVDKWELAVDQLPRRELDANSSFPLLMGWTTATCAQSQRYVKYNRASGPFRRAHLLSRFRVIRVEA
jgi:hypothetical protein